MEYIVLLQEESVTSGACDLSTNRLNSISKYI